MKGDSIAGRYRVDKVVGVGSSGFVVAARHIHTRDRVTLKVLTGPARPDARAAMALSSPNVARIVDAGVTEEGYPFIATEHLEGRTIADIMLERGALPARLAVSIVMQACAGLAEAHAAGIVHGDLKPQNLFLTTDGVLKILDFGMMMPLSDQNEEASAAWFASPAYLAPEQLRDPSVDARADVWALGVVLHHLVAGKLPFDAETIAGMFVAVAYDEPALLAAADVPFELATIVHACLAKSASGRPATVTELAQRLAPFAGVPDSMPPQMAMTIDADDILEPGPVSRMAAAVQKTSSRPPPLPGHRIGASPRSPRLAPVSRFAKGWLSARLRRLPRVLPPDYRTPAEQDFQRRRWGAIGVVAAAAVLGVASLFASSSSASAASELQPEEVAIARDPMTVGLGAFIPPSFALPEREDMETTGDRSPAPAAALLRPVPRLSVRNNPYTRNNVYGFTHPSRLTERRGR